MVGVDYFTRFVLLKSYLTHTAADTMNFMLKYVVPIFDWPEAVYHDNGSHFTQGGVPEMYASHGVRQFCGPISHPSSTGLAERYVQLVMAHISVSCREC